jgi:NAD-reducing hydrogenase large subunit
MAQQIVIEPITRIEGHGKITIQLDSSGKVTDAQVHVTQFRGFEKFCEGRPFYEMPSLVERICGICPISHSLASAKACDAILGVRIPETASKLRRLLHCASYIQSRVEFLPPFAPDLLLGMDSDPAKRNILRLMEANPSITRTAFVCGKSSADHRMVCRKRIHPSWVVQEVSTKLFPKDTENDDLAGPGSIRDRRAHLIWFKRSMENYRDEIRVRQFPSMFLGLMTARGIWSAHGRHAPLH